LQIANCKLQIGDWRAVEIAMTPDELSERLLDFAVRVGNVVDALPETRLGRHIAGQLVRCGTSPPANYEEACGAESKNDFVHKVRIVLKELRETRCWLRMIVKSKLLSQKGMSKILDEASQLCNIIGKSVATARLGKKINT
jgi:four helix bundle protein